MTKEFDFENAMKRLKEISELLESDDVSLDQAISLFDEGLVLSKQCQTTLENYETRVKNLVKQHQEGLQND